MTPPRSPSSCWRCRVLFEEAEGFRLRVFGILRESGPEVARAAVDDRFAEEHAHHAESWV